MHRDVKDNMVTIEIRAIQRSRVLRMRIDEDICVAKLCDGIRHILKDTTPGLLISCEDQGMLSSEMSISKYGIRTGSVLIYISKIA